MHARWPRPAATSSSRPATPHPDRTLERARALGAEDRGELRQRDTYFAAPHGRLKLREQEPGGAELIAYERPDAAEARESRYRITPVPDAAATAEALDAALGTVVVVDKRRHLLLWEGVRIHLDRVEGLGAFVELEGVAAADSDLAREGALVARLRAELGIADDALEPRGYADLLLGADDAEDDEAEELLAGRRRGDDPRPRALLAASRSAPPCGRPAAASTSRRTSRTPPTRRASAPRRRRSA